MKQTQNRELLHKSRHLEQVERELESLKLYLRRSEKIQSVGQLATELAHELNNFLGVIRLHIDDVCHDLSKGIFNEKTASESLRIVQEQVVKMADIILHLRFLSSENHELSYQVTLVPLLQKTVSLLKKRFEKESISIEEDYGSNSLTCWGNPNKLEHLFINLLINAKDALIASQKTKKLIRIVSREWNSNYVEVRIEDNGIGIDPEVKERLFDPFFTTKQEKEGLGVGLTIAKRIVREHAGRIYCESTPGDKTVFIIRFPKDRRKMEARS